MLGVVKAVWTKSKVKLLFARRSFPKLPISYVNGVFLSPSRKGTKTGGYSSGQETTGVKMRQEGSIYHCKLINIVKDYQQVTSNYLKQFIRFLKLALKRRLVFRLNLKIQSLKLFSAM